MDKGLRQFGREIGISHTAIANAMKELGIEGIFQGPGKPTLLNEYEQGLIALHFERDLTPQTQSQPTEQSSAIELVQCAAPQGAAQVSIIRSAEVIDVSQVDQIAFVVPDKTRELTAAVEKLTKTIEALQGNDQALEGAMMQNAVQRGAELGTRMAVAEVGRAAEVSQAIKLDLAKKLGIVQDSEATSSS